MASFEQLSIASPAAISRSSTLAALTPVAGIERLG